MAPLDVLPRHYAGLNDVDVADELVRIQSELVLYGTFAKPFRRSFGGSRRES